MTAVLEPAQPGQTGPTGPAGPTGPQGDPGPAEGFYHHVQNVAATQWAINHMLGRHPLVAVVDSAGTTVEGAVTHIDDDNLVVDFAVAFGGTADLT